MDIKFLYPHSADRMNRRSIPVQSPLRNVDEHCVSQVQLIISVLSKISSNDGYSNELNNLSKNLRFLLFSLRFYLFSLTSSIIAILSEIYVYNNCMYVFKNQCQ